MKAYVQSTDLLWTLYSTKNASFEVSTHAVVVLKQSFGESKHYLIARQGLTQMDVQLRRSRDSRLTRYVIGSIIYFEFG